MDYGGIDLKGELMIVDREGHKQPLKITSVEFSPIQYPEITGYLIGSVSKRRNGIKDVIFNNPATVVIWEDGTKTVVKCQKGDTYSEELGLAMCIAKKFFGNKGNFNEVFKKWIPENPIENGIPKVGTKIKIIDAKHGALGANGRIGIVTDRPSCAGMLAWDPGYNVDTGNGRIWRINSNAEIEILN